jgi:SAM-dependent methyltransferase
VNGAGGREPLLRRVARRVVRALNGFRERGPDISTDYRVLGAGSATDLDGWRAASVPQRQHDAFAGLVEDARLGSPRRDFAVAAEAVRHTGLRNPSVLEVGCGSGYYAETLPMLLRQPVRYLGLDYSIEMVRLARRAYPAESFVAGDGRRLPFGDRVFDVVMSGTSLMHIAEYDAAIRETVRVSAAWCVFHTVPVMERRATTLLQKRAYGESVVEVIFNRSELEAIFSREGLRVEQTFESIPYDLSRVLGERTFTMTYLCRCR